VDGAFGLPYRTDSEVRAWMARDPIVRMGKWLIEQKIATDAELKAAEAEAVAENKAAWEFAFASPKCKPEDGLKNAWAFGDVEATQFLDRKGPAVTATPAYVREWAAIEQWEA
jgi:TPP-dependent pyruvate/acetoin dehydrogenase alpha subunit